MEGLSRTTPPIKRLNRGGAAIARARNSDIRAAGHVADKYGEISPRFRGPDPRRSDDDTRFAIHDTHKLSDRSPSANLLTSKRNSTTSRSTERQLRNCHCRRMATSHLSHLGCNTHRSTAGQPVVEAVAAVVDPLAAVPIGQPAYSACRRPRAPHPPERSLRLAQREARQPRRSSRRCCVRRTTLSKSLIAPFTGLIAQRDSRVTPTHRSSQFNVSRQHGSLEISPRSLCNSKGVAYFFADPDVEGESADAAVAITIRTHSKA